MVNMWDVIFWAFLVTSGGLKNPHHLLTSSLLEYVSGYGALFCCRNMLFSIAMFPLSYRSGQYSTVCFRSRG